MRLDRWNSTARCRSLQYPRYSVSPRSDIIIYTRCLCLRAGVAGRERLQYSIGEVCLWLLGEDLRNARADRR